MSRDFGACVVAIPKEDLPAEVEGGAHVTLAYFGEKALPGRLFKELSKVVETLVGENDEAIVARVDGLDWFGEDEDAHVLILGDGPTTPIVQLRESLIDALTPELEEVFSENETFPVFRPHLTLGYLGQGYEPDETLDIPDFLNFRALAVWSNGHRVEFDLDNEAVIHGDEEELGVLAHYGVARRSGRYPWGSGETPYQNNKGFLGHVAQLKKEGLSEKEIAEGMGLSIRELRDYNSIAKNFVKQADASMAFRLKEKGLSNVAIGERMGIRESSVRALLDPAMQEKRAQLESTIHVLKNEVDKGDVFLDIGAGVEHHMGLSRTKLNTAITALEQQGYKVINTQTDNVGVGSGKKTTIKVLAPPGTSYRDVVTQQEKIKTLASFTEDGGKSYIPILPPRSVDSKRIKVVYAEDGGADADGVVYVRPGVEDISLGGGRYAQVRIAVDGTHYLKGMAIYKSDIPAGVDLVFNTNKSDTGNKLDAMKKMQKDLSGNIDKDEPFGSQIRRQHHYVDASGKDQISAMNLVNEEGLWINWSKTFSSQMLSKQPTAFAKQQLDKTYAAKKAEFDEIMELTNPTVKKQLLMAFADGADSSAVYLKAAGLPRTQQHVLIPVNSMKDTEVYAPQYRNGETVVLVRHPHGGRFEIPQLTVNNRNPEAKRLLGTDAPDAIGINARVAERLSGADFDGDTVLVIPNNQGQVKTSPPLKELDGFNPRAAYPAYEGMKPMKASTKQQKMGDVSNLITDMTIKGAPHNEIARAVKHSMVVIDAEKWNLNWKQSAVDNGIAELKKKYQGRPGEEGKANSGASTIISLASSRADVPLRKPRRSDDGGPIDRATGKLMYTPTGESYIKRTTSKRTGVVKEEVVTRTFRSKKMLETDNAHTLSSGQPMEELYADHANRLKSLANQARKTWLETQTIPYSPSAKKVYAPQVDSLVAKLNLAQKNAPLERQAQLLANQTVAAKKQAHPEMDQDQLKKVKSQALQTARARTGAGKTRIDITPLEWEAIQAGAISNSRLESILNNTDLDRVKALATPRSSTGLSTGQLARARAMLAAGATQADVADAIGVSTSALNSALNS